MLLNTHAVLRGSVTEKVPENTADELSWLANVLHAY